MSTIKQEIDLQDYNIVTEGSTNILFPKSNAVFYNPVQQFNRDMSIAAIRTWSESYSERPSKNKARRAARVNRKRKLNDTIKEEQEHENGAEASSPSTLDTSPAAPRKIKILEALSATGLRAIRYAKEIPNLQYVVANDLEAEAVNAITRNVEYNGLIPGEKVRPNKGDACSVMYAHRETSKRFDVVDLDPYGTASLFLDGAVQAVADGGLLCVTCTDLAVLAGGAYPEKSFANYGGLAIKTEACHEGALRLVLHAIQTCASRYQRIITPLVSLSIDFYVRVFVRVDTSAADVKFVPSRTMIPYYCGSCHAVYNQYMGSMQVQEGKPPKFKAPSGPPTSSDCRECGDRLHMAGPMWGGSLHDKSFVSKLLTHVQGSKDAYKTSPRMEGMLTVVQEELETPFYFSPQKLSRVLHCETPQIAHLSSALLNAGHKISASHALPGSIKTDADRSLIWDIMRSWVKAKAPVKEDRIKENTPQQRILAKEIKHEASFEPHPDAVPPSRKIKLVRYQQNPEPNWGPKARAGGKAAVAVPDTDDTKMDQTI